MLNSVDDDSICFMSLLQYIFLDNNCILPKNIFFSLLISLLTLSKAWLIVESTLISLFGWEKPVGLKQPADPAPAIPSQLVAAQPA